MKPESESNNKHAVVNHATTPEPSGGVMKVITLHRWALMVQQHIADPTRTPQSQGWTVVDEAANLPRGNVATRWAISTSQVAGDFDTENATTPEPVPDLHPVPMTIQPSTLALVGDIPPRRKWSDEDIRQLVELRGCGVPYSIISKNHLNRNVKSCQLKFDRVKKESPYKEILDQAGVEGDEEAGVDSATGGQDHDCGLKEEGQAGMVGDSNGAHQEDEDRSARAQALH